MKKEKISLRSKSILAVNLVLIVVLMTVSVYAWFAAQVNNTVDAYDIVVESDNALELSFDQETWSGTLNLANLKDEDGAYVFDSLKLVEVTSNGYDADGCFRIPQLTQYANYAVPNTSGTWETATANKDYLDFTVYMRSKDKLEIYLSSASEATPASSVVTGSNCGNPSDYATGADSFSKDCVVGALRVSYKNTSGNRYIWITNPEYHLNNAIGSDTYTMDTSATSSSYSNGDSAFTVGSNFYWNNPYVHYYYNTSNTLKIYSALYTLTELPDTVSDKPESETSTRIAELSDTQDDDGYYTGEVNFRIWIEGCDTEARRALVGGKFNLSLVLDSFGVE